MRNLKHPRWDDVASAASPAPTARWSARPASARRSRITAISPARRRERVRKWDSCFTMDFSYIHGGSVRKSAAFALSPMDDPQARDLDRPVRHLGLRRLRPLHHLVPGRHRHHRGGGRDQGEPAAAEGRTAWRTLSTFCRSIRSSPALAAELVRLVAGCARNHRLRGRRLPVPRGRAGRRVLSDPPRQGGLEIAAPGPRRDRLRDRGRRARSSAPPGWSRPIAGRSTRAPSS